MYTSHPAEPSDPGGRPEYFMTQLRSFAMIDTVETFRQWAIRNARDWTKEQRDEIIRQANRKADEISSITPIGSSMISSFTTEVSPVVATSSLSRDAESQSQEPYNTPIEASHANERTHQESETSADELAIQVDINSSAKRSRQSYHRKR